MSESKPADAASCRAMASQCAVNVKEYISRRQYSEARKELERAKDLTLLALWFDQEQPVRP